MKKLFLPVLMLCFAGAAMAQETVDLTSGWVWNDNIDSNDSSTAYITNDDGSISFEVQNSWEGGKVEFGLSINNASDYESVAIEYELSATCSVFYANVTGSTAESTTIYPEAKLTSPAQSGKATISLGTESGTPVSLSEIEFQLELDATIASSVTVTIKSVTLVKKGTSTAISTPELDTQVVSTTYYSLAGVASSEPVKGINIVKKVFADGSFEVEKIQVR